MLAERRQIQTVRLSHARKSMILLEAGEVVTAAACKYLRHEVCWIPVANFPVHETSDNIVLWLRQKIMQRVGRGGTQGAGGAGGGASSYDQAFKSLNKQWLQMRFTTQVSGSEVAVLKLSHRKFLAPGGLAKIKSQEDVFDVVVYGVTLCAMFLATPRHTAVQRMKAQAKVERGALHTHVCCCRPYLPL
jgi:hypothetical protein